jgi:hypothetical protein
VSTNTGTRIHRPNCPSSNLSVEISEKRVNARCQFFLLQSNWEPHFFYSFYSFYSFRPEDAVDAFPALVDAVEALLSGSEEKVLRCVLYTN